MLASLDPSPVSWLTTPSSWEVRGPVVQGRPQVMPVRSASCAVLLVHAGTDFAGQWRSSGTVQRQSKVWYKTLYYFAREYGVIMIVQLSVRTCKLCTCARVVVVFVVLCAHS